MWGDVCRNDGAMCVPFSVNINTYPYVNVMNVIYEADMQKSKGKGECMKCVHKHRYIYSYALCVTNWWTYMLCV